MSIKERIIQKRKELNLNQTELAKRAGLQPPAISQYESGSRTPSYDALVKLSHALQVSIDYLVSGSDLNTQISNPTSSILLKVFQNLDVQQQQNILNYVFLLAGNQNELDYYAPDSKQYAQYIYEQILNKEFPIDIYKVLNRLNLHVIKGDLEGKAEALLLKQNSTIILDNESTHEARVKRTLATLIGHFVIPWHSKKKYYYRLKGKSTTKSEDIEVIEAGTFATNLITPPEILEADLSKFSSGKISLTGLKELADEKYKVSLTSLCYRLVEHDNTRFAVIKSSEFKVNEVVSGMKIDEGKSLNNGSKAHELLVYPSEVEELKEGKVSVNVWLDDPEETQYLYESSIYNPKYNSVLTLLSKL